MSVRTKKMVAAAREAVAYHEAGHAVAAHRLGYEVRRVSIAPKSGSTGHVSWRNPIKNRSVKSKLEYGSEADLDRVRHHIDHAIIVCLAGKFAQKRHNPRSAWRYGGSGAGRGEFLLKGSDDQQALELMSRVHEDEKVRAAYSRYLEARAEDLVKRHWSRIERLAITLLDRETISGDIREAMIKKAISGTA
jgi:ATP-dependent Zn protease